MQDGRTGLSQSTIAILVFDIDGVVRDVGNSYRRALADTVEQFTAGAYRPTPVDIDILKGEGIWNNDWEGSCELVYRYFERQGTGRSQIALDYDVVVQFFQSRYRGADPDHWTGYICDEPLLMSPSYLQALTEAGVVWGFFSGATRGSATFVLEKRLELRSPILVAMEDAPGKPDPTGLHDTIRQLEARHDLPAALPVIYAGDTVADMQTVVKARSQDPSRAWVGVGILPPHVLQPADYAQRYGESLREAGASLVLDQVQALTVETIRRLPQASRADLT